MRLAAVLTGLAAVVAATPALAHHPLGGAMPETISQGLLSGVGHPIIGIDHLAFIIGAGIIATMVGRGLTAPLALVAGALLGAVIHFGAVTIPGAEILIALSVIIAGGLIFTGARVGAGLIMAGFAVAGIVHGYAYAEAVVGAEQTVIAAYLISFSATQWTVACGAGAIARIVMRGKSGSAVHRAAGMGIAAVGAVFLTQAVI